jgi:serine/threonine-protein kinase RsbW
MNFKLFGNSQGDEDFSDIDEIGKIGIKLIGKIADELSYTRTSDGRNCLLIVKYYQQADPVQPHDSNPPGFFNKILNSFKLFKPHKKISIQRPTDIKSVTQVLSWLEQLDPLPIPEAVLHQCKLVVIEGFTNVVRHAHKNLPRETPIDLEITVFNERLEIKIWDGGKPFDFKAKLKEELQEKSPFSLNELEFML